MRINDSPSPKILKQEQPPPAASPQVPPSASRKGIEFLTPGKIILAHVLKSTENGEISLAIGGKEITAKSVMKLPQGENIWLEVKSVKDLPWLELAGRKGPISSFLQFITLKTGDITTAFNTVNKVFQNGLLSPGKMEEFPNGMPALSTESIFPVNEKPDPAKLVAFLSALAKKSDHPRGIPLPPAARFGDIDMDSSAPAHLPAKEGKTLELVKQFFEILQAVNTSPVAPRESAFFIYPCFFSGCSGWGEWMFSFSDKEANKQGRREHTRLDFFLQMSNIGQVSLQVVLDGHKAEGIFYLENEAIKKYMDGMTPLLEESLRGLGYHCLVRSVVSQENQLLRVKKTLEEKMNCPTLAILDITA